LETVLITGGTGLVGRHLCKELQKKGYGISVLSRVAKQSPGMHTYVWDYDKKEIEKGAVESADYIIHLAGESIGDHRWTARRKQLILDSRVKTGDLLFDQVKACKSHLKAFISASATGYYGAVTSEKIFSETDLPFPDFLGEICRQWEESADRFQQSGIRTVKIRTGVILTRQGGALARIKASVQMGLGSALGKGNQYFPWIHIDDLCGIYIKAIEDAQMIGAYNAVAPDHKTNTELMGILSKVLKKPFWPVHIPAIVLKGIFGRMSDILLKGSRVSSAKIREAGYHFLFPDLQDALTHLVGEKQSEDNV